MTEISAERTICSMKQQKLKTRPITKDKSISKKYQHTRDKHQIKSTRIIIHAGRMADFHVKALQLNILNYAAKRKKIKGNPNQLFPNKQHLAVPNILTFYS